MELMEMQPAGTWRAQVEGSKVIAQNSPGDATRHSLDTPCLCRPFKVPGVAAVPGRHKFSLCLLV